MTNKYFTLNHIDNTIEGTKTALKRAGVLDTPEFNELCELKNRFPNYKISVKSPKKNHDKKTYNGLTIEAMKDYIIETQSDREAALKKFEAVKRVAKAKGAYYPLTKKWFLANYPEFTLDKITDDEAKAALSSPSADPKKKESAPKVAPVEAEAAKELEALEDTAA